MGVSPSPAATAHPCLPRPRKRLRVSAEGLKTQPQTKSRERRSNRWYYKMISNSSKIFTDV